MDVFSIAVFKNYPNKNGFKVTFTFMYFFGQIICRVVYLWGCISVSLEELSQDVNQNYSHLETLLELTWMDSPVLGKPVGDGFQ